MTGSVICPACRSQIAVGLLTCPSCNRLTHADRLQRLAGEAEAAERAGELTTSVATWREAIELLPPASRQHGIVAAKIEALTRRLETQPPGRSVAGAASAGAKQKANAGKRTGIIAAVVAAVLLLTKFKFVLFFILAKAKFLLLGLSKFGTLWSMLLSMGVYWAAWGWKFALGLVVSLYVHEMGHVAALHRLGFKASAPMFVPGLGAYVRLHQNPANPHEDARIGLAGPWWGMGAALVSFAGWQLSGNPFWAAMAETGAWLNLFNLLPIWQLDGGRGFNALSRLEMWICVAVCAVMFAWSRDGLTGLVAVVAVFRAFTTPAGREGDRRATVEYCTLVIVFVALFHLLVPVTGHPT